MRICKILRTECQRQIPLYRACLHLRLRAGDRSSCGGSRWRELSRTIDRTADFLWQQTLPLLGASIPGRRPAATGNKVHKLGDVRLPKQVEQVLSHGPKFAVEPRKSPPELLSLVRQVSGRAAESESDRCIADGVDVLLQCRPSGSRVPVRSTVAYLKDNALSLLPADKEGGFVVLPKGMLNSKALDAIEATFVRRNDVSLAKVKIEARKLCKRLSLDKLALAVDKGRGLNLDLFFSAKTHKANCPLRVIVSEFGTWQKSVAMFLQTKLNILVIDDPFQVKNSEQIIDFLKQCPD